MTEEPCQARCHYCIEHFQIRNEFGWLLNTCRMVVCSICGNKRCPKAENHRYKCTGSNEVNQIGELEASDEALELGKTIVPQIDPAILPHIADMQDHFKASDDESSTSDQKAETNE